MFVHLPKAISPKCPVNAIEVQKPLELGLTDRLASALFRLRFVARLCSLFALSCVVCLCHKYCVYRICLQCLVCLFIEAFNLELSKRLCSALFRLTFVARLCSLFALSCNVAAGFTYDRTTCYLHTFVFTPQVC